MKRNRLLWIGALLCAGASADLSIVPLQQGRVSRDPVAFVEARNGDLLLLSAFLDFDFEQRPLHKMFLHVLREDGRLRRRIELPVADYASMVAFSDGAAVWQRPVQAPASHRERIVAIGTKDNGPSRVIYQMNEEVEWLYLGSSPNADALYVAETLRPFRMRLTKFDRHGRQSWQKTFQGSHASNLAATHDGVALIRGIGIDTPASRRVVTLLSADGEVLWDAPVSIEGGGVGTLLFQRSGLIAVADYTHDAQARLAQYDITTGRLVRTSFIPPFRLLRETSDGLLLFHEQLEQPYIAMIGDDATPIWQRRFQAGNGVGSVIDGLITRSGRFAFLSRWHTESDSAVAASLAITDRSALSLQQERGSCTQANLLPILEMERRLRRYHAIGISLAYDGQNRGAERAACAHPTDVEYASFVRQVSAKMGPDQQPADYDRKQILARVAGSGPSLNTTHYALGSRVTDGPSEYVEFEVRYDAAAEFVKHVNSVFLPHYARMQTSRQRLFDLTGCWIWAKSNGNDASDAGFLDDMERALDTVYDRVAALDPETLLSIRREGYCAGAMLLLHRNEFGGSLNEMMPIDAAGEAFLHAISVAREERARR